MRCETDAFLFFHSSTPSGLWGFQEIQIKGKPIIKKLEKLWVDVKYFVVKDFKKVGWNLETWLEGRQ
jgi:hypothetical protein